MLGTARAIIPPYLEHLDNALENFCARYWPCEYIRPGRGRCVNVRSGHTKGHQSKSGRVLAHGDYLSTFSFESSREQFANDVYTYLDELLRNLPQIDIRHSNQEDKAATELHKTKVLRPFFTHSLNVNSGSLLSHTVCFCCLFDIPEHALPCGHVLCTRCLKDYGNVVEEDLIRIWECPIDGHTRLSLGTISFRLKPADCGIRILTLDG